MADVLTLRAAARDILTPARPGTRPEPGPRSATQIGDARPQRGLRVTGVIRSNHTISVAGSPTTRCRLADDSGEIDLLFLGRGQMPDLRPGQPCEIQGTVAQRGGGLVVWNPRYQLRPGHHAARW